MYCMYCMCICMSVYTVSIHVLYVLYPCVQFVGMPVAAVQQIIVKVSVNCTTHPKYCGRRRMQELARDASTQLIKDLKLIDT